MIVLLVFAFVYLGMIVGRAPGLALDRTGVALLGAIILLATEQVDVKEAWEAVDVPTIGLLFGLMVLSAQFRLGGMYTAITRRIVAARVTPQRLLGILIGVVGLLSALLANDIVCLAVAPLLVESCAQRKLNPVPFLLGLACAANIGSAATLIGNPQNMLIGQKLGLSFAGYLLDGGVPATAGLIAQWWLLCRLSAGRWEAVTSVPAVKAPTFNPWQSAKGTVILLGLVVSFLVVPLPREVLALAAGGLVLASRRMHTRRMLGLVDWQLLVLFVALFVVNHALEATGVVAATLTRLAEGGLHLERPGWLFAVTAVLSNMVSNVPAVMLLLPAATHPLAGAVLALSSTLAGNLIIVGSIANIIVVDQAQRLGVHISWREHARVGVPVTVVTLLIAAAWLALRAVA
ncbi:MAG TPA: anion transporter [Phycisphaerae bacterium]|nr:anion transporter [Phycisphaerae bacterium]HNU45012.1 anion transporter [Phycisphaerae bacterium]